MVGVDVGFENPTFACLELDYEEADQDSTGEAVKQAQQTLTYYELDLGSIYSILSLVRIPGDRRNLFALSGIRINRCLKY